MTSESGVRIRQELRRFRRLALSALDGHGIEPDRVGFIHHGENVTYRVRVGSARRRGPANGVRTGEELLLRVHRPDYHAHGEILSELAWLQALDRETDLEVPRPVPAPGGELLSAIECPATGESHACTLLKWTRGRRLGGSPTASQQRAIGRTLAAIHRQALAWRPGRALERPVWDWNGLFNRGGQWGDIGCELADLFSEVHRRVVREALERIRHEMERLDRLAGARALIHADLHPGNIVFARGRACPIDFDDCGEGYLIYDLAAALSPHHGSSRWDEMRDSFLEGYAERMPLDGRQLRSLPHFLLARRLTMAQWMTLRSRVLPQLPRDLSPYLERVAAMCHSLLQTGEV